MKKNSFVSFVFLSSFVALTSILIINHTLSAQTIRCYTVQNDSILRANNPKMPSLQQYERWMDSIKTQYPNNRIIGGVYIIPVIVHVIHSGEAIGVGKNLSQAVIQSQMDVMNEDFRKKAGSLGWNTHPDGADTEIEFCLARRRPDGTAFAVGQEGVNRINSVTQGWGAGPFSMATINATIKVWTYNAGAPTATRGWIPGNYMNFWTCDISGGILGYAQFPQTPLNGMGCGAINLATDGVVMLYNSIGKSSVTGYPPPYAEGRTATHEVGHWLGLRHIWGDAQPFCGDDYCGDTPQAANPNFGCPVVNSCAAPGNDQVENYMDYSDDLCMNMFTYDQKMRMRIVLENTPIRISLINSNACDPPNPNDASVINILNPVGDNCAGAITPQVTLRNRGSSVLTSAVINYKVDTDPVVTFAFAGAIAAGASLNVSLPAFTTTLGNHTLTSYSTLPNTVADPSPLYDTTVINFAVSNGYMGPYVQDFNANNFPPDIRWTRVDPNNDCYTWMGESAVSSTGVISNNAAMMRFYDYNTLGRFDYLYTPIFILPCNATVANIRFDVAYRRYDATTNDRLQVEISTDCGATWNPVSIYDKAGLVLATLADNVAPFIPSAAGNWRNETVNLMSFVTGASASVKFRFKGTTAYGNNLWVDNFQFNTTTPGEIRLNQSAAEILDAGAYNVGTTTVAVPLNTTFTITNTGTTNLVLTPPITITGTAFTVGASFAATIIAAGGTTTFTLTFNPAATGAYSETVSFATNDCDENPFNFRITGTGDVAMPVELLSFTAECSEAKVNLEWATATENNNDYFVVEKSADAKTFYEVAQVKGAGNSSTIKQYSFTDRDPLQGKSYYRLSQTDFDGSKKTYAPIAVSCGEENDFNITVNANPVTDGTINLSVSAAEGSTILLVLTDVLGRELYSKAIVTQSGNFLIVVNPEQKLAQGMYSITASNKDEYLSKKIIVR